MEIHDGVAAHIMGFFDILASVGRNDVGKGLAGPPSRGGLENPTEMMNFPLRGICIFLHWRRVGGEWRRRFRAYEG